MKTMIGLTKEQLAFAVSLADYATAKLKIQHKESHSGVDRLILDGWIISSEELANEFRSYVEVESVSDDSDLVRPEA
jgi:hypothetical protein